MHKPELSVSQAVAFKSKIAYERSQGIQNKMQNAVLRLCDEALRIHEANAINERKFSNGAGLPHPHMQK